MFSSNQVLEISGSLEQLEEAIEFAMRYSGNEECFTRRENPLKCVYQITDDDRYCIGWAPYDETPPDGWSGYPFDYAPKIISEIARQWIEKAPKPVDENAGCDGVSYIGFLLQESGGSRWKERGRIKNGRHCIVTLRPFWCFYHK